MIRLSNLAEVNDGIDRWLESVEELADGVYRGLALYAFSYIVKGTPEWSGNLAANWRLSVGAPVEGYDETVWKGRSYGRVAGDPEPFSKRSPNFEAMHYAISIAQHESKQTRLGAPIFISNSSPYVWEAELNINRSGKPFLRMVNLPVEMVHAAADKFGSMGQISEATAHIMAGETLDL